ncbi:protein phosphatase 2C, putative [Entamoeba dispar SAW760]|uniref:Protein phosphatase 2C, putative n=1 Tax=Entamoeba dispar (strain ATCC PRA-260 / SAW760) TaxID=370354 RepID=B0ETM1_ENTDS|nr:protein phosphatase 2C, putative [Entamoeba dispar SAW760]EDR22206.1 protein phosphatase 2C, putative [Entamoeba dispar SAW760]|eukprot:EDR22206.1 protein phosphatase 2C, putative [Entamoeba dispar SAW760]
MCERINAAGKELKELPKQKGLTVLKSINVTNNCISNIDEINEYKNLECLLLRKNKIEQIPAISIPLQVIDISLNPIKSIKPLLSVSSIKELTISQCHFLDMHFNLSTLENLTKFVCISNKLVEIEFLRNCCHLRNLDLSNNLLIGVPECLSTCTSLTSLNLRDNNISKGLHYLNTLKLLAEINVSWNDITELKKSFYNIISLTSIKLNNNKIRRIHKNIGFMTNLVELYIQSNLQLHSVHSEISKLTLLTLLNLDNCPNILELPTLNNLTSLVNFSMKHCSLTQTPLLPLSCDFHLENNNLTVLNLDISKSTALQIPFNKLTSIPSLNGSLINRLILCDNKIRHLDLIGANLLSLNISFNPILTLPTEISSLTKLRQLCCSGCGIREIPDNLLNNFKNLEQFECSFNPISTIIFLPLANLQSFVMQFCHLTQLPFSLEQASKLRVLDVSNNKLSILTSKKSSVETMSQLTLLDCSHNQLKSIGDFSKVTSLVELNVSYNPIIKIEKLMEKISKLPKLTNLYCHGISLRRGYSFKGNDELCISITKKGSIKGIPIELVFKEKGIENTLKRFETFGCDNICNQKFCNGIGSYEYCGRRISMQDSILVGNNFFGDASSLFGIFDGHGGDYGSCFISKEIQKSLEKLRGRALTKEIFENEIISAIQNINTLMEQNNMTDGATSVIVASTKTHYLIANIGDSRAVIIRRTDTSPIPMKEIGDETQQILQPKSPSKLVLPKKTFKSKLGRSGGSSKITNQIEVNFDYIGGGRIEVEALTHDHKPSYQEDRQRIRETGNYISDQEKVNGYISVTRAIGDVKCKTFVSCIPEFSEVPRRVSDCFVICACDGVWDVFSNEEIGNLVMANEQMNCTELAKLIVDTAYCRFSSDNMSCIVFNCQNSF